MSFVFIITRHVNSEKTNKYWNRCVSTIRIYYPKNKIVVIDDNSNYEFVVKMCQDDNVQYVQSEFPGRGELLPYYYYYHHPWHSKAVIIHDSIFFHSVVPFGKINLPVCPLWHFTADTENVDNSMRIIHGLKNGGIIRKMLKNDTAVKILGKSSEWNGCFGIQCMITHVCLQHLQNKFNFLNLVNFVHNRPDRCCFERIFACMIYSQYPALKKCPSLFGNIFNYLNFGYSYEQYINDVNNRTINKPVIKVWTGR
jgi:hypothetical protein